MELFADIGSWFGFVGACVANAEATCRPFLAFMALLAASGAALTLLLIAFRQRQLADSADTESDLARRRELEMKERLRRTIAARRAAVKPVYSGRYRVAA